MSTQAENPQSPSHLTAEQQQLFNRAMWLVIGIFIGWLLFSDKEGYVTNVFTEIVGVAGTFFVLDFWVRRRDEQREVTQIQKQLLSRVRSRVHHEAIRAVEEIRDHGWLEGSAGILQHIRLVGVDLHEAKLSKANLNGAELRHVILQKATLWNTNLVNADLSEAKLQNAAFVLADFTEASLYRADLTKADLNGANLGNTDCRYCNFRSASLIGANLSGANLRYADLSGTILEVHPLSSYSVVGDGDTRKSLGNIVFDSSTILPDGTNWTPDTDMRRFTDPKHPDFWWL